MSGRHGRGRLRTGGPDRRRRCRPAVHAVRRRPPGADGSAGALVKPAPDHPAPPTSHGGPIPRHGTSPSGTSRSIGGRASAGTSPRPRRQIRLPPGVGGRASSANSLSPARSCRSGGCSNRPDVRPVLPSVHVPTLVTHRTHDPYVEVAAGRYVAEQIPRSALRRARRPRPPRLGRGRGHRARPHRGDAHWRTRRSVSPTGCLATVLFTDIVGSTEQASVLGDRRWREMLADHDEIGREEIDATGAAGSNPRATVSSPPSTPGPSDPVRPTAGRPDPPARPARLRAGIHTVRVRAASVTTSAASPCTSRRASPPWLRPNRVVCRAPWSISSRARVSASR